jgi:hypothetical protein
MNWLRMSIAMCFLGYSKVVWLIVDFYYRNFKLDINLEEVSLSLKDKLLPAAAKKTL